MNYFIKLICKKTQRKSDAENKFISKLATGFIWLGITDEEEEGYFVDIKGSELSWKNQPWASNQPDNRIKSKGWFAC